MAFPTNANQVQAFAGAMYGIQIGSVTLAQVNSDIAAVGSLTSALNSYYAYSFGGVATATVAATVAANLGLTGAALTEGTAYITAQLNAAAPGARGAVIASTLNLFAGLASDATFGAAATAWNTKVAAAAVYTGTTDVAIGTVVAATAAAFTLTTGTNNFTGTAADDTFDAGISSSSLQTLNSGDNLDGGAGTDELYAVITGSVTPAALKNIENVYVTNTTTASSIDFSNATGLSTVTNSASTVGLTMSGLKSASGPKVIVRDTAIPLQYVTFNDVTGSADSAAITINNLTSDATLEVAGVESLTLNTAGSSANVLTAYNGTATNATTTLTVAGAVGLTVTNALPSAVTKVDGSALTGTGTTGTLKVIMGSTGVATVVGGAGNDSLSTVSTTGIVSVDAGAGNDTILAGAYLTTTDTINGGDGTADVLTMTSASALNFTAAPTTYLITNVETVGLTDAATTTSVFYPAYISATATRMNMANAATATDVTAGAVTVVGGTTGDFTVGLGGSLASNVADLGGALTLTTTGTGTSDTVTLVNSAIENTAGTNINVYNTQNIVTSGYEKLVVGTGSTSSGVAMTTGTITVAGTAGSTSAETVTFTGAHRMTSGVITADIVDASAMTYSSTTATLTMVTGSTATTVTGSAGFDILYGATGTASSITGGAGNDSIYGGTGNDTLLGGDGVDSITGSSGNDSINAGAGNDTINMAGNIASGDVINGGDGTDTILSSIAITAAAASTISNIEVIGFTAGVTQDMVNFLNSGITTVATISGSLDVDNAQTTLNTMVFGATAVMGTPSIDRLSDGSSDAMSLMITDGTTPTFTSVDMADEETLTISEYGTDSTAAVTIAFGTVTATDLKTLYITGSNNHSMTLSGNTALATVDASAATGTLNITDGNSLVNQTVTGPSTTAMTITGGSGNDSITGGASTDSMVGGAGNDTIVGNAGNDTIIGGLGIDSLVGGDGTDTISADYTLSTDGGSSTATGVVINLSSSSILATTIDNYVSTAAALLGINSDITSVATGTMVNLGLAANVATLSSRVDTLSGFEAIQGSTGTDYLVGNTSANTITGGTGADVMVGGTGADTFALAGTGSSVARSAEALTATIINTDTITFGNGVDVITDFTSGTDFLDFTVAGATTAPTSLVTGAAQAALVIGTAYYLLGTYVVGTGVFTVNTAATSATTNVAMAVLEATTVDTAESANHTDWTILMGIASIATADIV